MSSLNTVSKDLSEDLLRLNKGKIQREDFLQTYGHLRPGTYDITSPSYRENFDEYFSDASCEATDPESCVFEFSDEQILAIEELIQTSDLQITAQELIRFIRDAIEAREYAKLIFTRSLSEVLALITQLGKRFDIDKEALQHLDFREVLKLYSELDHRDMNDILGENIELNQDYFRYTQLIKLPDLIRKPEDVYNFYLGDDIPNYITSKRVEAPTSKESELQAESPEGKIVFIQSADPGYDFLFNLGISGLVTQFGGSNSHMAIRCAELGLPAIIGAGEKNFDEWMSYQKLRIDCSAQKVMGIETMKQVGGLPSGIRHVASSIQHQQTEPKQTPTDAQAHVSTGRGLHSSPRTLCGSQKLNAYPTHVSHHSSIFTTHSPLPLHLRGFAASRAKTAYRIVSPKYDNRRPRGRPPYLQRPHPSLLTPNFPLPLSP